MCAYDDSNRTRAVGRTLPFGDVCLLGLGVTGRAVIGCFLSDPSRFDSLTVYPGDLQSEQLAYINSLSKSITVRLDEELVSGTYDLAVVSPGIPPNSAFYKSAQHAAREVISEPELAWRVSPQNWIAVTGTNGKTTVTELISSLLEASGKTAWVAGNIGTPCIEVVGARAQEDWLVAELSSYQLHSTKQLAPDIAVLLNITPDHLSWHGSHESYAYDKKRILANLTSDNPAIIDVRQPETHVIADELYAQGRRVIRIGCADGLMLEQNEEVWEVCYVNAATEALTLELASGKYELLPASHLRIKGPHNISNALAAAAVAAELGASVDAINAGLESFVALPNRFEPCGEVAGVSFINDSKATNIDAAIKALSAFVDNNQEGQVIALFGGLDKGASLDALVAAALQTCKYAVCYGEAAERFYSSMAAQLPSVKTASFDEAFFKAFRLAEPGDTVLLSPACASFDEFGSFEARGERFKENVERLRGELNE